MSSPLLALFNRSLREDARSRSTYLTRAALVGVILLFMFGAQSNDRSGAPGLEFFTKVIYINLLFVTLVGLNYFASAIAEEKEETTLGLLRMTNLNPLSILLGKSTSRLLGVLLLLLAQVPFTMLAITLGGVSLHQIAAAYCTLGAYIFLLCNLALLFSVICRRTAGAAVWTFVVLALFFLGPGLGLGLIEGAAALEWLTSAEANAGRAAMQWMLRLSPFTRVWEIMQTGFTDPSFGLQVVANFVGGIVCFLLAWAGFDHFTRDLSEAAPRRKVGRSGRRLRAIGAGRPWANAVAWKEFHFTFRGRVGIAIQIFIFAACAGVIAWIISATTGWRYFSWLGVGIFLVWFGGLFLVTGLGHAASEIFRQELRWKTWSSLTILPLSIRALAYRKIAGALVSLTPASLIFCVGWIILLFGMEWEHFSPSAETVLVFVQGVLIAGLQVLLFPHVVAYISLRLKHGALPLGIAIMVIGNMFVSGFAFALFQSAGGIVLICLLSFLICLLHMQIGARLTALAAEEN